MDRAGVSRALLLIVAPTLLLSCGSPTDQRAPTYKLENFEYGGRSDSNYLPKSGYVDKPEVAVGIAEAIAMRFYGRSQIERQRPYLVKRLADRWVIQGSFPTEPNLKGGVFEIEVSSSDGRILRLIHGE